MTGYREDRAELIALVGTEAAGVIPDTEPTPAVLENHSRVLERVDAIVSSVMDA